MNDETPDQPYTFGFPVGYLKASEELALVKLRMAIDTRAGNKATREIAAFNIETGYASIPHTRSNA